MEGGSDSEDEIGVDFDEVCFLSFLISLFLSCLFFSVRRPCVWWGLGKGEALLAFYNFLLNLAFSFSYISIVQI